MAGETRVTSLHVEVLRSVRSPIRVTSVAVETLRAQGPSEELAVTAASIQIAIAAPPPDLTISQAGAEVLFGGDAPMGVSQAGVEAIAGGVDAPVISQAGVEVLFRAAFEGCDTRPVFYRLRIRNKANDEDLAIFTSLPSGENSLIADAPEIDAATIDVLRGTSSVGGCNLTLIDRAAGDCSERDATDRAVTKLLADDDGQLQVLGLRAYLEATEEPEPEEGDWGSYWAGFIANVSFPDAITAVVAMTHTTRDDTTTRVWAERSPHYPNTGLIVGGPVLHDFPSSVPTVRAAANNGYWTMKCTAVFPTFVRFDIDEDASAGGAPSGQGAAFPPPDIRPYLVDRGFFKASNNDTQRNVFAWLKRNVQPYYVEGAPTPAAASAWTDEDIFGWYPRLELQTILKNGSPFNAQFPLMASKRGFAADGFTLDKVTISQDLGNNFHLYWPSTSPTPQPAVNDVFEFYVHAIDISEANPLLLLDHPVTLLTDLWDSLDIPYDTPSANATRTALGAYVVALRIPAPRTLAEAQQLLCGAFGFNWRWDADGKRYLFPTRVLPAPTGTITLSNLRGADGVIWEADEASKVFSVSYNWKRFVPWPGQEDAKNADRAHDGIQAYDVGPIKFVTDAATQPFGSRDEKFDVPGCVMVLQDSEALPPEYIETDATDITARLTEPLLAQFANGGIESTIDLGPTVLALEGQIWNLDLPHRPGFDALGAPVAQRGIVEQVQVVSRTPYAWGSRIKVLRVPSTGAPITDDDGTTPPTPVTLDTSVTASASSTVVTLTIVDVAGYAAERVYLEVEYLGQPTMPTGSGTVIPRLWDVTLGAFELPAHSPGTKVWYRVRTVNTSGARGNWSDWDSITLGTSSGQEGTGAGLQTPTIALNVSVGVISADVDGGPSAVKAYCAVSITAYPTAATVLAGATDTSVPFSFASLVTLTPGQTAFVAVITEDALGNRSIRATALYTLPVSNANAFGKVIVTGQSDVDADSASDTLEIAAGSNITITTTPASDKITISASGGGSGPQFPMLGYNTAGGSAETMTRYRAFLKKFTPTNSGLLQYIAAYVNNNGADNVQDLSVALFSDSGGSPLRLLAYASNPATTALLESVSATPVARWLGVPLAYDLVGGTDYWLAVMNVSPTLGTIAYDGSGTDKYFTSGGAWWADAGFYTVNTGTRKYSIRARMLEGTLL